MIAKVTRTSMVWKSKRDKPDRQPHENAKWNGNFWQIEVDSLNDILGLHHEVILIGAMEGDPYAFELEIYDDYRE